MLVTHVVGFFVPSHWMLQKLSAKNILEMIQTLRSSIALIPPLDNTHSQKGLFLPLLQAQMGLFLPPPSGPDGSVLTSPSGPESYQPVLTSPSGPESYQPVLTSPSGPEFYQPVLTSPSDPESYQPVLTSSPAPESYYPYAHMYLPIILLAALSVNLSLRTTTRSISTQTPEPPKTQAAQTKVFPSPAPNTPIITISAAALADVLSSNTNHTTNAPEIASFTDHRHLSLPQAARRKIKPPTTDVTDSSDEEILVGAPPPQHKYDIYSVQDLLMETTSPNSDDSTAMSTRSKAQPKKKWKTLRSTLTHQLHN
ncbi:uncharacterized protein [Procambarus clarkii]|uniref:uncharacterized protein n=1 Tax=Procambarus clarkii TaxID=6728 RepID=UPI003742A191